MFFKTDIHLIKHDPRGSPCTADFSADRPTASQLKQGEQGTMGSMEMDSEAAKETSGLYQLL